MSDIAVISRETDAPGPKTSPSNHSAWLEQLESAQWQQRLRYQSERGQRQGGELPAGDQRAPQQSAGRGGTADFSQAGQTRRQAGVVPDVGRQDTRLAVRALAPAAPAAERRPAFGLAVPAIRQAPLGGTTRQGEAWPQSRRLPTLNWQAQHAHVMAGNDGLRVWLRDARYERSDGCLLLQQLRGRFARLGFRLAEFTLNGEQVAGSDQSGQSD